eukprot:364505-Chlamydomonas_euryale.AAC.15
MGGQATNTPPTVGTQNRQGAPRQPAATWQRAEHSFSAASRIRSSMKELFLLPSMLSARHDKPAAVLGAHMLRPSPIPPKIRTRARSALHIDVAGSHWGHGACAPTSVETRRPDLRPDPARHRKSEPTWKKSLINDICLARPDVHARACSEQGAGGSGGQPGRFRMGNCMWQCLELGALMEITCSSPTHSQRGASQVKSILTMLFTKRS